jgi:hypothetical protein
VPMADRQRKDAAWQRRAAILRPLVAATQRLARSRRDVDLVRQRLLLDPKPEGDADDPLDPLRKALDSVTKELDAAEEKLWGKRVEQGIRRGQGLVSAVRQQLDDLNDTPEAPNPTELLGLDRAEQKVQEATAAVDAYVQGPLATFRTAVEQSGLSLVPAAQK